MSSPTRVAIVTGAAKGIGAEVAHRLADDGLAVAVLDLDEAAGKPVVEEIQAAGGQAIAVGADVADEAAVQTAVDRVAEELGAPTVLVNNAGITRDNLLFKTTSSDWDAVMGVHLRGAFLTSRAVQSHMITAGWGRVVNMSSTGLGNRGQANYSASKAGIEGLTKTLAIKLGRFGITVNVVAPGVHRHRHAGGHRGAPRGQLRGLPRGRRRPDPRQPHRHGGGPRARGLLLRQRGRELRLRPGPLCRRRPVRMRIINIEELEQAVGTHLGYSDWHSVTQDQIDLFADATGDHQWIHVDQKKAKEGSFGSTIAHGYLTLSLVPMLSWQVYNVEGMPKGVYYGANRLRFASPVPVAPKVRAGVELLSVTPAGGGYQVVARRTVERDGGGKPACVVDAVSMLVP